MPRILTDDDSYDEHGQHRPRHGDWRDDQEREDRQPKGGSDETYVWRCSMCGRGREGIATCAICGDALDAMEDAA